MLIYQKNSTSVIFPICLVLNLILQQWSNRVRLAVFTDRARRLFNVQTQYPYVRDETVFMVCVAQTHLSRKSQLWALSLFPAENKVHFVLSPSLALFCVFESKWHCMHMLPPHKWWALQIFAYANCRPSHRLPLANVILPMGAGPLLRCALPTFIPWLEHADLDCVAWVLPSCSCSNFPTNLIFAEGKVLRKKKQNKTNFFLKFHCLFLYRGRETRILSEVSTRQDRQFFRTSWVSVDETFRSKKKASNAMLHILF